MRSVTPHDTSPAEPPPAESPLASPGGPVLVALPGPAAQTGLLLIPQPGALPAVWAGPVGAAGPWPADAGSADVGQAAGQEERCGLLPEHATGWFGRPGLSGHRLDPGGPRAAGRDWSPLFRPAGLAHTGSTARVEAADEVAGLRLVTDIEAVAGGAIRCRHCLTNAGAQPYVIDSLEVVFPVPDRVGETLDFTGGQLEERTPQRQPIRDGLWLREGRRGRTGHDSATVMVAGVPGFGFGAGETWGVHVAWSGNTVYRVERVRSGLTTIGGGELLLPGEVVLRPGESYATPWVYLAASRDGLDDLAAQFHGYLRSLPAHPSSPRPVNLNVWEAVYFDHDLGRLTSLADTAAAIGVERYVLDDGWFRGRRHDRAGLGDWWVDEQVWPRGLHPLVDHVRGLGLGFGLWIEPEMISPDSDLYRAHPDWILATGRRVPQLQRQQLVLDLTRPQTADYLLERITAVLAEYDIAYVKWDHNRDLLDAGSTARAGAPAVHDQTLAFYALLDELRRRHPAVEWESCAAGGGRIDLAVLERVQRVWTSDMTDALARQAIQRWTGQLVPPEYLGAHVSAPFSDQTGRYLPLSLRCATALFGHFGIEWDLTQARRDAPEALAELGDWIVLYQAHRELIHSGRVIRLDMPDDAAWVHGVVAADQSAALMSYVQLAPARHSRPGRLRVPGLDPGRRYLLTNVTPADRGSGPPSRRAPAAIVGAELSGAALAGIGLEILAQRPLTAAVIHVAAVG
jgi:alpha-galactosidase